jgi:hypothetical protein
MSVSGDVMDALTEAGNRIRDGAAALSGWSERIPESGRVESLRDGEVMVIFGNREAPHAYSFEVRGVRHPVFARGPRPTWNWVPNGSKAAGFTDGWRPFLAPAAELYSDEALFAFARVIDKWGAELGFVDEPLFA